MEGADVAFSARAKDFDKSTKGKKAFIGLAADGYVRGKKVSKIKKPIFVPPARDALRRKDSRRA
jgi:hypothetical protein